jgi:phosphate starvation-inducible PhoH-like protein
MVITGDVTQVDLPGGTTSGLRVIEDVLTGVEDVEFCRLTSSDVVRHRLVSDIIDAYARWDVAAARTSGRPGGDRRRDNRGARA